MILILLCFFKEVAFSQIIHDTYDIAEYGASFSKPRDFEYIDNACKSPNLEYFYTTKDGKEHNLLPAFYLQNKDSSILILVEPWEYIIMKPDIMNHYWIDPNRFAFNCFFNTRDTASPFKYCSSKELSKTSSDWIVEFTRYFGERNTLGEYRYNKSIVFNKNNQIFFQLTYLFKESSKDKMNELLFSTRQMFRFEERSQAPPVSIKSQLDRHYTRISQDILADSLETNWNRGVIYQDRYYFWGEHFAFKRDGIVISVKFPTNDKWPYINHIYHEKRDTTVNWEKWNVANYDYRRFLTLARDIPYKYPLAAVRRLNADEAYLFNFSLAEDDLYRDIYRDCKVVVFHKRNVGSIILKYYYKSGDKEKADRVIESTWGQIAFKDKAFFDSLEDKVYPF